MASQARNPHSPDHVEELAFRSGFAWQWPLIALCAATGLALSIALFLVMSQRETRLAEARFHLDAERQAEQIHRAVDDVTTSVQVLRAFFAGSELVEPGEFHVFTDPLAQATPNVLLFGWAPAAAGDDGKESFPALYLSDNDHLPVEVGWDLASVPECREALDRARKSGDLSSSAPFSFDDATPAVVLLAAVEENEGIEGFVFALFAPADVLRSALLIHLADVIHLRVMDQQEAGKPVLLAEHDGIDVQTDRRFRIGALELMPFERRWEVGGRTWLVECRPTAALTSATRSWLPWASATVAVLLTVAGVSILVMLALQTSRVERLVAARTAEVRQSEARLRTITDTALDAVIMMAPDGSVAHWNPAAEKMFGYRRSEIVGRDVHETLMPEEYRERALQGLRRFAETGEGDAVGKVLELEAVHKDGTQFPVEISVAAIRMESRWGAVAIVRDITRRRAAEEAVRREQALLLQLLDFQERERKLMAYEIHDGLVQQLTGAHLTLQSLPQAPGGDDTSARDRFEAASGLLHDAIAEARRII
ncbi:MAG: PAS domain S-box protein, partial [Thermoguttaceae bacterium]|nr:PAS domain S-box protein [Thermoguttaceae bacterium]